MTILDMLGQSGILTLLGMGVVFSFLIIMVIVISGVGKFIKNLSLENDSKPAVSAVSRPAGNNNNAVTAAISAAVNQYRKNN